MNLLGRFLKSATFVVAPSLVTLTLVAGVEASGQQPSYIPVAAPLVVDQKTAIPGHVLKPGNYSVRIIDHLKDRYILQVNDASEDSIATFIGVHNPDFNSSIANKQHGPILWNAAPKGETAIRGFSFANGDTLEFVYPKADAVTLAKLNTDTVPAIDPESEGRHPDMKLSPEDREVVTLWMLTPTRVGPKDKTPAIAAERFVAPAESNDAPAQQATSNSPATPPPANPPMEVASATTPPPPPAPAARLRHARPAPAASANANGNQAPRVHSSVKTLPQTASQLPLMLLLSGLFLFAAGTLRLTRYSA